ncbi:dipeptide ABC transporter ATP-binding protein (plasmid) [Agrobacterium sp. rho-13.3]|uniref:ABC transporter ATP-binding protein n=1 Tax=Agrobacterium sp. rho-13.3 TaxID=3072980 RepID=UPI002A12ED43|nr:ABC transporter ATP-binding protein [Agrobacterium sp. rho-13.3]MDX8310158.1 ABC transporter ATP-binding protein [Agrobacterium sp. rho-13.3]
MTIKSETPPLLQVQNLGLDHQSAAGSTTILNAVTFELRRGEILGVIGESGAGKSTLGNAVLGFLSRGMRQVSGTMQLDGMLISADRTGDQSSRGHRISAIFQDHTASLDPLMCVGGQVEETILAHDKSISRRDARARAIELLDRVGIPESDRRYNHYPHQFSGGQRQRAVIAIALAGSPDIIVADEPTSALDATVQKQILKLLRTLVDETGVSIILVTHDMGVVSEVTDRVLVMRKGQVVEQDDTAIILDAPKHDYTRSLLAAVPRLRVSSVDTNLDDGACGPVGKIREKTTYLVADGITKSFFSGRLPWPLRRGQAASKYALHNVSLKLPRGEITGIVGESGSGKTTIGRILAGLETASAGTITLDGKQFNATKTGSKSGLLGRVQMIFQDPAASLNPRIRIGETLKESIRFSASTPTNAASIEIATMMERLGLPTAVLSRYPHQLSGGQKQRVCIARALLAKPQIVVADEPTSALDVSVQADIVKLLKRTITEEGITMVFISHDLAVVQQLCSSVMIFKDGQVEDAGPCDAVFSHSSNPYTRTLIDARPARFAS